MPIVVRLALTLLTFANILSPSIDQTPRPALRIVVIDGENAVNIIQQKTAVAPVVEVLDRNNLPVPGATVTFQINGGAGTFGGGASQVTITTNAAGRATVAELNPLARGTLNIQVSATSQGQTATASISQTNYATASEAASAGSGAGQAAAGGGGMSKGVLIGLLAAGGGGVAVAATRGGGGGSQSSTTTSIIVAQTTTTTIAASTTTIPASTTTTTTAASSSTTTSVSTTTSTSTSTTTSVMPNVQANAQLRQAGALTSTCNLNNDRANNCSLDGTASAPSGQLVAYRWRTTRFISTTNRVVNTYTGPTVNLGTLLCTPNGSTEERFDVELSVDSSFGISDTDAKTFTLTRARCIDGVTGK